MDIKNIKTLLFENIGIKQTIFKNTLWLSIAEISTRLIGFFIVIWLARHFGPGTYGKFAFALSFVALFAVFTDFGFTTLIVREIARDKFKTPQYIDNIIMMKVILGLITLGLIAFLIQFLGKEPEVLKLVYFLGIYIVINSFAGFFQSVFRANEKMQYEAACRIIQSLAVLGLVTFFIFKGESILGISYAFIGGALIGVLFSLIFVWRYFSKFFFKIDFKICKEIFSQVWPFGLIIIAISIYYYMGSVILGIMKSNEEVGWYNTAHGLALLTQVFGGIISTSFFPQLSQKYKESSESLKVVANKFAEMMNIFAWPIALGGTLLASQIIIFLYGKDYLPGTLAFQILIWTIAITYMSSVYGSTLQAADRQKLLLLGVGGGAILNIILNFLLIPYYSLNGAAAATLLTEIAIMIYVYIQANKLIRIRLSPHIVIPLCSSVVMGTLLYFYFSHFNLILAVALGASIYFLIIGIVYFYLKHFK